jgi:glycosyltransferase involved in cell wall biosynthesis
VDQAPSESRERLCVLVPCLNERGNVEPAVREVLAHADELPLEVRVVMIDDGSTDGTREEMERLAAADPRCEVRVNARNMGLGRSVMNTVGTLDPEDWVTVYPGDNEFLFLSIRNFVEARRGHDLLLGYLYNPVVRTLRRRLASYAFTKLVAMLYGFPWRYLNGMKMYRARVFQGLEIVSSGHAFMAESIAKAQLRTPDLRIGEVPFYSRGRGTGRSKAIRPTSVARAVFEVIRGSRAVSRYRRDIVNRVS